MTIAVEKNPPVKLPNEPTITPQVVAEHGLAPDEYERLLKIMGRTPTMVELGIFSAMWSEHCSYKSSKVWLKKLPTKAPWVIQGPGENAGVIDIGDGQAAIFKMESHNHPSYIEPYQGAATGVGGILRDVFTMGARPVANLNALRFGDPKHPKTRHLVSFRSTYQFSRFTYVRARVDYDSSRRNYGGQLLFGWNPNPGTAFYVGYNDTFNYNGYSPITGQYVPGFVRNNRTFFIRASYLFRKSF